MAGKQKSTIAKAQTTFLKALRDFEKTVAGLVSSPMPKRKAKKKSASRRKTKGGR
jgi:hypothetical protein